jgi:hypothetical protein
MAALALAGCAGGPRAPDWQIEAQGAAERFSSDYLQGQRAAEAQWQRLRWALAATADPQRLARAELLRCALEVASLNWQPLCAGFDALKDRASPGERAYAEYLQGRWTAQDLPTLGPAQRQVAQQGLRALPDLQDPLSRLLGAAVLLRSGSIGPAAQDALISLAVDTASAQGWRRPLRAWLGLQRDRAQAQGRSDQADRIRQRLALLEESP